MADSKCLKLGGYLYLKRSGQRKSHLFSVKFSLIRSIPSFLFVSFNQDFKLHNKLHFCCTFLTINDVSKPVLMSLAEAVVYPPPSGKSLVLLTLVISPSLKRITVCVCNSRNYYSLMKHFVFILPEDCFDLMMYFKQRCVVISKYFISLNTLLTITLNSKVEQ